MCPCFSTVWEPCFAVICGCTSLSHDLCLCLQVYACVHVFLGEEQRRRCSTAEEEKMAKLCSYYRHPAENAAAWLSRRCLRVCQSDIFKVYITKLGCWIHFHSFLDILLVWNDKKLIKNVSLTRFFYAKYEHRQLYLTYFLLLDVISLSLILLTESVRRKPAKQRPPGLKEGCVTKERTFFRTSLLSHQSRGLSIIGHSPLFSPYAVTHSLWWEAIRGALVCLVVRWMAMRSWLNEQKHDKGLLSAQS